MTRDALLAAVLAERFGQAPNWATPKPTPARRPRKPRTPPTRQPRPIRVPVPSEPAIYATGTTLEEFLSAW